MEPFASDGLSELGTVNPKKERLRFFYRQKSNDKALVEEGLCRLNFLQFLPFFKETSRFSKRAAPPPAQDSSSSSKSSGRFYIAGFHPLKGEPSLWPFYKKAKEFMVFPVLEEETGGEETSGAFSKQQGSPSDFKVPVRRSSMKISGEMAFYKPTALPDFLPDDEKEKENDSAARASSAPANAADANAAAASAIAGTAADTRTAEKSPSGVPAAAEKSAVEKKPNAADKTPEGSVRSSAKKSPLRAGGALLAEKPPAWRRNRLGFAEPNPQTAKKVSPSDIFLFLVPGLSFDRKGRRLGRGGGFYDRFLSQSRALKAGVASSARLHEEGLPEEAHDIRMNIIVTENFLLFPDITKFCGG